LSLIINPQIKDELGESFQALFTFPLSPDVQQNPYDWNNEPDIKLRAGIDDPDTLDDYVIKIPKSPQFPGFEGSDTHISGTNYAFILDELEGFVFKSEFPFYNISKWTHLDDVITGDTDRLQPTKEFRISHDTYVWSEWMNLTLENLNEYATNAAEVYIEFKYIALPSGDDLNVTIPIDTPTSFGWVKVMSAGVAYRFNKDYSDKGELVFKIGDTILSEHDILFGETLQTATEIPTSGDYIFLNPMFQGIRIDSDTQLEVTYQASQIADDYKSALYLHHMRLTADKEIERLDELFTLDRLGDRKILSPPFLMKAFKITDFHLDVYGVTETRTLDVQYRYSANQKKWSQWEKLTQKNISTIQIDTLSFFYIEVAFTRTGTDECSNKIYVNDLVFEGDIQNVSADYLKINKFGLRSDCDYCESCGDNCADSDLSAPKPTDEWSDPSKMGTFNPYEIYKNVSLYNKLANDAVTIAGWSVTYYTTPADGAGKDRFLKEYQLYNYGDYKDIKVIPADNKFPESMLVMNGFDFALLESFEVHITMDVFKKAFGVGAKPNKKDRIWFCQANKLYEVEHAQKSKDFMNSGVFYKLRLKPASNDMSIGNAENTPLGDLMKNSSIDSLFGLSNQQDTDKVVKKEMLDNLSDSKTRKSLKAPVVKYDLQNGVNLVSKNHYSFQTLTGRPAVVYNALDTKIEESDDRTFMCWFNIAELKDELTYNLIDNIGKNGNGYRVSYHNNELVMEWNSLIFEGLVALSVDTWYAVIVSFNQRQQKLEWAVYTRFSPTKAGSHSINDLELVANGQDELTPQHWDNPQQTLQVYGSPIYYTNMRVFKTSIPQDKHFRVLNQYIVKDTSMLLVADNANNKIIAPKHKF
jgi:hypothetical protein